MIRGYAVDQNRLHSVDDTLDAFDGVIWIDLFEPTRDEEAALESRLGIDIPTREEMEEIEISSRLYLSDGAVFMTTILPARADSDDPEMGPVTFILVGERLLTVRYHEPRAFQSFPLWAEKSGVVPANGDMVLISLLEATIDRMADILERIALDIDRISRSVFQNAGDEPARGLNYKKHLSEIGRKGDLIARIRDSLLSLERVKAFLTQINLQRASGKEHRARIKTIGRDTASLMHHADFLSQKITFLLDATLGMLNIEQNDIIKVFSIAAVVFLPPTLIASIYGMNFHHMPELSWVFGYPFALLLMVASAVLPFLYVKRKGWL